ncbi:transporter [Tritrichomonas foetus]|uniref:Lysosomal dipeptide transporter MFSD1 n=1 Tax=Tritrichomonas foetus TaxID=1144522 RepID=A0A1J4K9I8_9EUKA|nr:transporter [Tritrichomonas foetus]|eukprot:OHT08087.1 transporter [Tritrichomonas foetus]
MIDDEKTITEEQAIKEKEAEDENQANEKRPISFHVRRISSFIIISLLYALVFFHRTCPSIVSEDMAIDYGVAKKQLGIFSSVFFYPYGIIQPFAGLFADIIEPSFVIGFSQLLAGVGAFICGFSKSIGVGCLGRFLVGLGCGPTYVPVVRCIANWFSLKYYPHMCGVLLAIGGVGGIIAQGPLASFAEAVGWRWSFYGIGCLGIIISILCLVFVRGNPVTYGYKPVNKDLTVVDTHYTCKEMLIQLYKNLRQVVAYPWFWLVVIYSVFCSGPFFDISGMWAGPYLSDVYHYSKTQVGNTCIALSIGLIVGSLTLPPLSTALRTRKWLLLFTAIIACLVLAMFIIFGSRIPHTGLYILWIVFAAFTNAMTSVCYPLIREYFHPAIAGTAVGCANIFTFLSSAIFQSVSSELISKFGKIEGSEAYTEKGYKIGLWGITCGALGIAAIVIAFTKDTKFAPRIPKEDKSKDQEHKSDLGSDLGEL